MGSKLFIFNPEHDLALAVGKGPYTPPAEILKFKTFSSLLPAVYAGNSDFILVPDSLSENEIASLPYHNLAMQKDICIMRPSQVDEFKDKISKIIPWGWDHAVYESLLSLGFPTTLLPSTVQLEKLRRLSHRHTALDFRKKMARLLNLGHLLPSAELFTEEAAEHFLQNHPLSFFKAPWSSSGRGIVASSHISHKGLMEWTHGVIKKQGSVFAEAAWDKALDFATEWWIENGESNFLGYSVFETSSRGKYHKNITDSQENLLKTIKLYAGDFDEKYISAQKRVLDELVSPDYTGPLGIDMLVDKKGLINPCVEINLRLTMGLILTPQGCDYLRAESPL